MTLTPTALDDLTHNLEGLQRLVALRLAEDDPVDYKVDLDLHEKNRRAARELRADCAALATAGTGYLIVGVDESRDGRSQAERLVGIERARATRLKTSIEDLLGTSIEPPFGPTSRSAWLVDLDSERSVLVVRVSGRLGYPVAVSDRHPDGEEYATFYTREAGKKRPLTTTEGLARRERLDHQVERAAQGRQRRRQWVLAGSLLAFVVVGVPAGWVLYMRNRALEQQVGVLNAVARARTVNVPQLALALSQAPGTKLQLSASSGDLEAHRLAVGIWDAANSGNWAPGPIDTSLFAGPPPVGILVFAAGKVGEPAPRPAQVLVTALRAQGLGPVQIQADANLNPGEVRIVVGAKPPVVTTTAVGLSAR